MKTLLLEASNEIESLRRRNEILQAKVDVMDFFACVLHTSPAQPDRLMAVDIAWKLREAAEKLPAES